MKNKNYELVTRRKVSFVESPPFPENMLLELTNACNHSCIFCAHSKMRRKIGFMDYDFCKRILKEAFELGTRQVGLYMTGEPLLYPHIEEVIRTASDIGYEYIYMTTNGVLAEIDLMKRLVAAGLNSIKFSVNGADVKSYQSIHGKDDFECVIDNLKALVRYRDEYKRDLGIFATFIKAKQNFQSAESFENFMLNEVGVDQAVVVEACDQGGNMTEEKENFMLDPDKVYIKAPCELVFNRINITYEGYLNACCVDFDNYLAVDDLNKVSLEKAWNSELFRELRLKHLKNSLDGTLCHQCIKNSKVDVLPLNNRLLQYK